MKKNTINILWTFFLSLSLVACSHHESTVFTGDYRYYAGISELFDCQTGIKYFFGKQGITNDLQNKYLALELREKEDVYLKVEGYLTQESAEESLIPATIFVATEFISFDTSRGCKVEERQGY